MHSIPGVSLRHAVRSFLLFGALLAVLGNFSTNAVAQSPADEPKLASARPPELTQTFFLVHATEMNELTDILTDLRNMLPRARAYGVASQFAITVEGTPDEVAAAQKLIAELDRPRKMYRLTYTLTEMEAGKAVETHHLALTVNAGGRAVVKQGNRVPIMTGTTSGEGEGKGQQVQYVDMGLNIEATLDGVGDDLRLRSRVERSSVSEEKSGIGAQDPVIQQTQLDDMSMLAPGKLMMLGSLDIPGSTRHEEVAVVAELLR